jgi:poly(A) polymerase Pap1
VLSDNKRMDYAVRLMTHFDKAFQQQIINCKTDEELARVTQKYTEYGKYDVETKEKSLSS